MAAATFRTRPWQLAPLACPAFTPALHGTTTQGLLLLHTQQQTRHIGTMPKTKRMHPNFRATFRNSKRQQDYQEATSSLTRRVMNEQQAMNEAETAVLAPRTLIPFPLQKTYILYGFRGMYQYWKEVARQRLVDRAQIIQQNWSFKPSIWKRSTFRLTRDGIVEKALELHAEMSHCLAVGGEKQRKRLTQICVPKLHRSLLMAISGRPEGHRYQWELVSRPFTSWRWPRLIDHKWLEMNVGFMQSYRQAVVGIKSKQRLTTLDKTGKVVETKEKELTEYLVLWREVDKEMRMEGEWLIYGTLKETTLEEINKEAEEMQTVAKMDATAKLAETRQGYNK